MIRHAFPTERAANGDHINPVKTAIAYNTTDAYNTTETHLD
ncbi:hypothetical protein [Nostoc parmelioides]|nr:hypothetical protein [Nostoc parmelioides]